MPSSEFQPTGSFDRQDIPDHTNELNSFEELVEDTHLVDQPEITNINLEDLRQELAGRSGTDTARKFYSRHHNDIKHRVQIDNYVFLLPNIPAKDERYSSASTVYLVHPADQSGPVEVRVARASGSDKQYKLVNGVEDDGRLKKGQETIVRDGKQVRNPDNHYVQSNKLDPRFYWVLETLRQQGGQTSQPLSYHGYVPVDGASNEAEDRYQEQYTKFDNPQWDKYQQFCKFAYNAYNKLIIDNNYAKNMTNTGGSYSYFKALEPYAARFGKDELLNKIQSLLQLIDTMSQDHQLSSTLRSMVLNQDWTGQPELDNFKTQYLGTAGQVIEDLLSAEPPQSIMPDFSADPIQTYVKANPNDPQDYISVKEYQVSSPQGDTIRWAMAHDSQDRYYIDNVYDPTVGLNSYGAPAHITNMGILVYKPEDYRQQTLGIPEQYKKDSSDPDGGRYTDISALWLNNPIITGFKQAQTQARAAESLPQGIDIPRTPDQSGQPAISTSPAIPATEQIKPASAENISTNQAIARLQQELAERQDLLDRLQQLRQHVPHKSS